MNKLEEQINENNFTYRSSRNVYYFRRFQTIRFFGDSFFNGEITISEADKKQNYSKLLYIILNFNNKVRQKSKADKEKKQ